jgi:tRNA A-37 threonylcarbamoyl transferase component Bud32
MAAAPDEDLKAFLEESGLGGEDAAWQALAGGVSSEIWRVDLPDRTICIKRALPKLRVEAEWRAPVQRNASEWAWFETAGAILPGAAPPLLAHDPARGVFAMAFLPPTEYPLWKAELLAGRVDVAFAGAVGDALGRIHRATAGDAVIAARFRTDETFHALRLEPYLLATGEKHAHLKTRFLALAARTGSVHAALVHGDISPKNILMGPHGPVFLDAETAWYGDPAFDLAFCLNHLVLKALVRPREAGLLEASFAALREAYLAHVRWEAPADLEARAACLLPALMLARVDGKSPVEYLDAPLQAVVRTFAMPRVETPDTTLVPIYPAWRPALAGR